MSLFRNPKSAQIGIVIFVLLLLLLFAVKSRGSELQVEGGAAVLRGYTPALGLSIQWPDAGPAGTDYELGFMLVGDGSYNEVDFGNQVVWYGMLWDGYRAVELGIGAAYFNVESPFTCQFTFALGARWRFARRVSAQWRHYSTAGSCQPNSGRDLATISYRF
jgi:hypothetical protein